MEKTALTYHPHVSDLHVHGAPKLDIVGDVHGCFQELVELLQSSGYELSAYDPSGSAPIGLTHPEGRRLILLGDLTDRGPRNDQVMRLAIGGRETGTLYNVMGNHDWKLMRHLLGRPVGIPQPLAQTLVQLNAHGTAFTQAVRDFFLATPHQIRIPINWAAPFEGAENLWIVHGAARAHRQGKSDKHSFERSVYGYADGSLDETGWLQRENWADDYIGLDPVIHGHVVHREPSYRNRVMCLDTGCAFGNKLTMFQLDTGQYLFAKAHANHAGVEKVFH